MGSYVSYKGKTIATGWPATIIAIVFICVLFTVCVGVGAAAVIGMMKLVFWTFGI